MSHAVQEHVHRENLHRVYNITSKRGYVNLSITQLNYIGFFYDDTTKALHLKCSQGGMAIGMLELCNNYTSNPSIYNDKYITGIVSGTRDGLIVSDYSFKHYSQVSVQATITTPCKGEFNPESKYLFYSLIPFSLAFSHMINRIN